MKLASLLLMGILGLIATLSAAEQRQFSAEDESVQRPVSIPEGVRRILTTDEMVRDAASNDHIAPEDFPSAWFLASVVHLDGANREDLILIGRGPMLGANITRFWVFRATANGYSCVLKASGHDLIITNNMRKGLREIELLSATGVAVRTVLFRFNGIHYRIFRDKWESTQ